MIRTTERLTLREFTEDDWPAVLAYQNDSQYLRFYPWDERTEQDVRTFIQVFIDQQYQKPRFRYQFAMVLKGTDQLIGNCGIRKGGPEAQEADIGYEIAATHWRKGYASEAAHEMLTFGFEELHLNRIWATCIVENTASARVLEKIGMQLELHLKEHEWMKGRMWDAMVYGMFKDEWFTK